MIKKISIIVVTIVALVLLYASTRPNTYIVTRSISIKASPEKIFDLVSDLHNWDKWSPWKEMDPHMKKTFNGPEKGTGATMSWDGNIKAGKGTMVITDLTAPFKILFKVSLEKPMKSEVTSDFTLEPKDGVTNVIWSSYGSRTYPAKVMSIFVDCEKMIAKDLDAGLAKLKTVAEEK